MRDCGGWKGVTEAALQCWNSSWSVTQTWALVPFLCFSCNGGRGRWWKGAVKQAAQDPQPGDTHGPLTFSLPRFIFSVSSSPWIASVPPPPFQSKSCCHGLLPFSLIYFHNYLGLWAFWLLRLLYSVHVLFWFFLSDMSWHFYITQICTICTKSKDF